MVSRAGRTGADEVGAKRAAAFVAVVADAGGSAGAAGVAVCRTAHARAARHRVRVGRAICADARSRR